MANEDDFFLDGVIEDDEMHTTIPEKKRREKQVHSSKISVAPSMSSKKRGRGNQMGNIGLKQQCSNVSDGDVDLDSQLIIGAGEKVPPFPSSSSSSSLMTSTTEAPTPTQIATSPKAFETPASLLITEEVNMRIYHHLKPPIRLLFIHT